jgi:hypothetical protein
MPSLTSPVVFWASPFNSWALPSACNFSLPVMLARSSPGGVGPSCRSGTMRRLGGSSDLSSRRTARTGLDFGTSNTTLGLVAPAGGDIALARLEGEAVTIP